MFATLAAIGWDPWFRGILTIIIAVFSLCGSVYLILGTNLGARLGFLVALAALAGWMFIMGAIWWTYGKGLLGEAPSWQPVPNQSVLQESKSLQLAGILDRDLDPNDELDPTEQADAIEQALIDAGWKELSSAGAGFQQASSAGVELAVESGAFSGIDKFTTVNVYDLGGGRKFAFWDGRLDFLAFFKNDHYAVVEIAPVIEQRTEPGRAPVRPQIDTTQDHQYIYMIRDNGSLRRPAAIITLSSLLIFLVLCYMLHTRDRAVTANRSQVALPAGKRE